MQLSAIAASGILNSVGVLLAVIVTGDDGDFVFQIHQWLRNGQVNLELTQAAYSDEVLRGDTFPCRMTRNASPANAGWGAMSKSG
jgi:hypothetical protein